MSPTRGKLLTVPLLVSLLIAVSSASAAASSRENPDVQPKPLDVLRVDLYGKRVWLTAAVNQVELVFQFDSAAGASLLTPKAAERVRLQPDAWGTAGGAGDNTIQIRVARDVTFRLGRVSWTAAQVVLIPLDSIDEGTGRRADGLIGKDFLDRYVVDVDYETGRMQLFDPSTYRYSGPGTVFPFKLAEGPVIDAEIEMPGRGRLPCRLLVDAPYTGSLTFSRPFIEKHDLLEAAKALTPRLLKSTMGGVGGQSLIYIGRVQSLALAGYSFERPVAEFCLAEGGTLARSDIDGLLGAEILRRFRVIFDYAHRRIILEPTGHLKDPFELDMSGLEIRAVAPELKKFTVRRVHEGSPAAEAGIRTGDIIEALNGRPADELTLPEIRETLRVPGRKIHMSIRRGQEQREVMFILRRLI